MKAGRLVGAVVVILVVGAGATAAFYSKLGGDRFVMPNEPAPYNSIVIGALESDVQSKIGKPDSTTLNPRYEAKSQDQWKSMERDAEKLEQRSSDPYGTMSPADHTKLVELRRTLEHRIKDTWQYRAPKPEAAIMMFEFDDQSKLVAASVNPIPHMGPPPTRH